MIQLQEIITTTVLSKAAELNNELSQLIKEYTLIEKKYLLLNTNLNLDNSLQPGEKAVKRELFDKAKNKELDLLNYKIQKVKENIFELNNDPLKIYKQKYKKFKEKQKLTSKKTKQERRKANRERNKKIAKSLAPVLANQLIIVIINKVENIGELQKLVNDTNIIIDSANTPETILIAQNAKNNAINIINSRIKDLQSLSNNINNISVLINIFSTLSSLLSSISIPTGAPLGIGIPSSIITKISKKIDELQVIIDALNVVLVMVPPLLSNVINDFEDLKNQLHDINGNTLNNNEISNINSGNISNDLGNYKGFKLILKEDTNINTIIRGNKRRYAVAINEDGIETYRSDYSYTLDPSDLVEQLKLKIDEKF